MILLFTSVTIHLEPKPYNKGLHGPGRGSKVKSSFAPIFLHQTWAGWSLVFIHSRTYFFLQTWAHPDKGDSFFFILGIFLIQVGSYVFDKNSSNFVSTENVVDSHFRVGLNADNI